MKKIRVTDLTGTAKAPFIKQTFIHTDEQVKEIADAIVKGLIGTYTTNDLIVLYGCVISGAGPYAITAGAIYYNGEVYLVDAASGLTPGGGQTLVFNIVTTYASGDPIKYQDGSLHNQHQIDKIALQVGASGSGIADYNASNIYNYNTLSDGLWLDGTGLLANSYTISSGRVFQYKKSASGVVTMRGALLSPPSGTSTLFITGLPVGLRPTHSQQYTSCGTNSSGGNYLITINSNGTCAVQNTTGGTSFIGTGANFIVNCEWRIDE